MVYSLQKSIGEDIVMPQVSWAVLLTFVSMLVLGTMFKLGEIKKVFPERSTILFKGATTTVAAALALYAGLLGGGTYAFLMAGGLLVCAVADMVLEKHFIAGMVVFALGHVFYITAFILNGGITLAAILTYAILLAIIYFGGQYAHQKTGEKVLHLQLYAGILSLMVALSVPQTAAATIGAFLFIISDGFIAYRLLVRPSQLNGIMCIILYYLGQFLLAYSAYLRVV